MRRRVVAKRRRCCRCNARRYWHHWGPRPPPVGGAPLAAAAGHGGGRGAPHKRHHGSGDGGAVEEVQGRGRQRRVGEAKGGEGRGDEAQGGAKGGENDGPWHPSRRDGLGSGGSGRPTGWQLTDAAERTTLVKTCIIRVSCAKYFQATSLKISGSHQRGFATGYGKNAPASLPPPRGSPPSAARPRPRPPLRRMRKHIRL